MNCSVWLARNSLLSDAPSIQQLVKNHCLTRDQLLSYSPVETLIGQVFTNCIALRLSIYSGVDRNEDVHLVNASYSASPPPPPPPPPSLSSPSSSLPLQLPYNTPAASEAASMENLWSTDRRRRHSSSTVGKSSQYPIPLSSSSSSFKSFDRSAAVGARWSGTDVDGRAPVGALTGSALQREQQRWNDVDICWNFSVGDEQRHELYSPRMTHPQPQQQQQHAGPHTIHQTVAPTSRLEPHTGTTTVQRRTHYPNKADCVRLLSGMHVLTDRCLCQ